MVRKRRSLLHVAYDGPPTGFPWLVLHGRHGDLAAARSLGELCLPPDTLRIAVRSARTQTMGSLLPPKGCFWFIGPLDRPELSTLGDALHQLDLLLDDLREIDEIETLSVFAVGESAGVALLLALLRPDIIRHVTAIDAMFPTNFDRMPIEIGDTGGTTVKLVDAHKDTASRLSQVAPRMGIQEVRARVASTP